MKEVKEVIRHRLLKRWFNEDGSRVLQPERPRNGVNAIYPHVCERATHPELCESCRLVQKRLMYDKRMHLDSD
jgi:hypothetical protein